MVDAVDEDVRGLHVAVDELARVRRIERVAHLADQMERALGLERPVLEQERAHVPPLDEPRREKELPSCGAGGVDGKDPRVVERGGEPRLAQEALPEGRIVHQVRRDQLQGDGPVECELGGAVHHAHPAPAHDGLEPVSRELRSEFRHHAPGGGDRPREAGCRRSGCDPARSQPAPNDERGRRGRGDELAAASRRAPPPASGRTARGRGVRSYGELGDAVAAWATEQRLGEHSGEVLHDQRGVGEETARVATAAGAVGGADDAERPVESRCGPRGDLQRRPVVLERPERDDDRAGRRPSPATTSAATSQAAVSKTSASLPANGSPSAESSSRSASC